LSLGSPSIDPIHLHHFASRSWRTSESKRWK
jgi:hypothetical protein